MNYNNFSSTVPAMPKPSKGTEIVKLILSQASKDMQEPLVPMAIPAFAAHVNDVEFMYSDNKYYELCGLTPTKPRLYSEQTPIVTAEI